MGSNFEAAEIIARTGCRIICTDIRKPACAPRAIEVIRDDIFRPDEALYEGADLLYAIRPGVEMLPPLIDLARRLNVDLLVYHPGDEWYEKGGEVIDCGVPLHRYCRRG